jgi:hypothetical protein
MRGRGSIGIGIAIAGAALLLAAPAGATTSQEAVNFLNQQRAANRIPSSVQIDQYRTTGCHNHNRYMEQNGLGHMEDPSKPGYTPEGADYTNSGEVLAQGGIGFTATSNPWDTAPIHQTILFDPQVSAAGYDEYKGFTCMRFGYDFSPVPMAEYYAFTSDTGRTGVSPTETVRGELPYAPQEAVGIPQGTATGPDIIFLTRGVSSNHAVPGSASVTGPSGAVDVRMVDSTTSPPPKGNGQRFFATGGDLIPVKPLEPLTTYDVAVTWEDDNGARMPQALSFTTAGRSVTLTLSLSKKLSRKRRTTLAAPAAAVGQTATVTLERRSDHRTTTKQIVLRRSQAIAVPKGRYAVTVTVPAFTAGDTRYTVKSAKRVYG